MCGSLCTYWFVDLLEQAHRKSLRMGQKGSTFSRRSQNTFEMLSMTWEQFVELICELNDRFLPCVHACTVLSLQKSLYYLLKDAIDETNGVLFQERVLNARALSTSECIICMERRPDIVLPCVHTFCSMCIEQWKAMEKDWCPLCHNPLQLDGSDTWVIPDVIESGELRNYLMSLTISDGTNS
ncbi:hypothetical protein DINM_021823 [Dirofilaria immitis]|nr:hypothetical protein [Dirofilaria immitis]